MNERYKPNINTDTRIVPEDEKLLVEEMSGKLDTPRIKGHLEIVWKRKYWGNENIGGKSPSLG